MPRAAALTCSRGTSGLDLWHFVGEGKTSRVNLLAPRLWPGHAVVVVAVLAAGWLGVWQYGAWGAHRAAAERDITRARPVPIAQAIGPDQPFPSDALGRPVDVEGTWVGGATTYVSDREHDGRRGYWVVTPLSVGGAGKPALPIVRGWVDRPSDAPDAPRGDASVTAWLQPPEGGGPPDTDPDDDVLPTLQVAALLQRVDVDLYGAYGIAQRPEPGLARADLEQQPGAGSFTGLRNLFYAFEWWFFGAFAVFVWVKWLRDEADRVPSAA